MRTGLRVEGIGRRKATRGEEALPFTALGTSRNMINRARESRLGHPGETQSFPISRAASLKNVVGGREGGGREKRGKTAGKERTRPRELLRDAAM